MADARRIDLLCVSALPAGTGFAWKFIGGTWVALARRLAARDLTTAVAFPPGGEVDSAAVEPSEAVMLPGSDLRANACALARFVRGRHTRVVYFSAGPPFSIVFLLLRLAGVRRIVIHDHESGLRTVPRGLKRVVKTVLVRLPWLSADTIVAVSDYVARRQIEVGCVPPSRLRRIWNAVEIPRPDGGPTAGGLKTELGLDAECQVIMCVGRATREKGMHVLLGAFAELGDEPNSHLVLVGDGPMLDELRTLRSEHRLRDRVHVLGYRDDVLILMRDAFVCVVPSLWEEGFGLTVIEAMAMRKPVVASRTGAIPEIILDGRTGILVEPGDEQALAAALQVLLKNPERARTMGEEGRVRAESDFEFDSYVEAITQVLLPEDS